MSELTGRHEGGYRGFTWHSKSYYSASVPVHDGVDEIMIGVYHEEGGTSGEFGIRWMKLGDDKPAARLEIFEDTFETALVVCSELMQELSRLTSKNPQPQDIFDLLIRLGYRDRTVYEVPKRYQKPEGDV